MSDRLQLPITSLAIFTGNIKPINVYTAFCYGTELNFKYNVYHIANVNVEALERDERIFAVVVLAAIRMLEAGGNTEKRGIYSLELLNLLKERGYDSRRTRSLQKFVYRILRINNKKINPKVREVWKMQLIPIDEAIREIQIRDVKEEIALEMAQKMLAKNMPLELIAEITNLDKEDILDSI